MDKDKDEEFNERILGALMRQVKNSDSKFAELEKNLSVKEAELQYLVKLYDEKISSLTSELEVEKQTAKELGAQMSEVASKLNVKDDEISDITSKINELQIAFSSKDDNTGHLKSEIENTHSEVADLHNFISRQEAKIQEMNNALQKKDEILARQLSRIEAIELELKTFKSHEILAEDTSGGERVKCAKCGAAGKDIKLVENKTKVLSYVGNMPMYAKIRVCKKCGYEF
jgi:chromosome segregation ATPase